MTSEPTALQSILLARLRDDFQVDISPADGLFGDALEQWLVSAEKALFEELAGGLNGPV